MLQMDPSQRRASLKMASTAALGVLLFSASSASAAPMRRVLGEETAKANPNLCAKLDLKTDATVAAIASESGLTADEIVRFTNGTQGVCKTITEASTIPAGDCVCLPYDRLIELGHIKKGDSADNAPAPVASGRQLRFLPLLLPLLAEAAPVLIESVAAIGAETAVAAGAEAAVAAGTEAAVTAGAEAAVTAGTDAAATAGAEAAAASGAETAAASGAEAAASEGTATAATEAGQGTNALEKISDAADMASDISDAVNSDDSDDSDDSNDSDDSDDSEEASTKLSTKHTEKKKKGHDEKMMKLKEQARARKAHMRRKSQMRKAHMRRKARKGKAQMGKAHKVTRSPATKEKILAKKIASEKIMAKKMAKKVAHDEEMAKKLEKEIEREVRHRNLAEIDDSGDYEVYEDAREYMDEDFEDEAKKVGLVSMQLGIA